MLKTLFAVTLGGVMAVTCPSVAAEGAAGSIAQPNSSAGVQTPLPAGRAASIREAQGIGRPLLYWSLAGGAIIAGVILLAQDGDEGTPPTTVTSGTTN